MSTLEITTANLKLVLNTREKVLAQIDAMSPSDRAQVSPAWLSAARSAATPDPWLHGFAIFDRETGEAIGNCAFKGPPTSDGRVEIAYGVDETYRGRGYATEAALALTGYAFTAHGVRVVQAHTLPEESASTRVLRKSRFRFVGEIVDPEDGLVWRWEAKSSFP
jgi:RimJ/RimL family protein N-acetyltransferase